MGRLFLYGGTYTSVNGLESILVTSIVNTTIKLQEIKFTYIEVTTQPKQKEGKRHSQTQLTKNTYLLSKRKNIYSIIKQ